MTQAITSASIGTARRPFTIREWVVSSASTVASHVTFPVAIETLQEMMMSAFNEFVAAVRDIPSVEQVRAQVAGTYIHLVTYLSESTLDQRYAVYDVQAEMYRKFPNLKLEFDVIDRRGYPVAGGELTGKYVEVIRKLPDRFDEYGLPESH